MKNTWKGPIISYVVGLCTAKKHLETLRVIVIVSMADQDHPAQNQLKTWILSMHETYSSRARRDRQSLREQSWWESPSPRWAPKCQEHCGDGARWRSGKQKHAIQLSKCHGDICRSNHTNVICCEKCISKADASHHLCTWLPGNEAIPSSASQAGVRVKGTGI